MTVKRRFRHTQIAPEVLPPGPTILGYIKIGGKEEQPRFTKAGVPWFLPTRFIDPVRFQVTTRERNIREINGTGRSKNETFKIQHGYKRDDAFHGNEDVGPEPTELRVRLWYRDWQDNFKCYFGAHDGQRWICNGNGVVADDIERGENVPCTCPRLRQFEGVYDGPPPDEGRKMTPCKPHGVFTCILEDADTYGGAWVFHTTGYENIKGIRTLLATFQQQFGSCAAIPLILKVIKADKKYTDDAGAQKDTVQPVVSLALPGSFDTARQLAKQYAAESRLLIAGPDAPAPEEFWDAIKDEHLEEGGAEIASEFAPETQEGYQEEHPESVRQAPAPVVEGDFEEESEGEGGRSRENLEAMCREVMALSGYERQKINRRLEAQKAKDGGLQELWDHFADKEPKHAQRARETIIDDGIDL